MAGARAMMRYRRTRASTTEAAAGIGSSIGKSWVGDNNVGAAGYNNIPPQQQQAYPTNQVPQSGVARMFFQGNTAQNNAKPQPTLPQASGAQMAQQQQQQQQQDYRKVI